MHHKSDGLGPGFIMVGVRQALDGEAYRRSRDDQAVVDREARYAVNIRIAWQYPAGIRDIRASILRHQLNCRVSASLYDLVIDVVDGIVALHSLLLQGVMEGRRERQASIHPTEGPFIRSVQILQMA